MTSADSGVVRFTCTRIQLIDALAALPLGGYLTLEARGRFADCILGQLPEASPLVTEDQAREIMQATVAEGVRPVIDAELAKAEAVIRADERARIRSLLPYHVPCCENFLASVGDLVNEHGDSR